MIIVGSRLNEYGCHTGMRAGHHVHIRFDCVLQGAMGFEVSIQKKYPQAEFQSSIVLNYS